MTPPYQRRAQKPLPLPTARQSGFEDKQFLICNANKEAYDAIHNWNPNKLTRWQVLSIAGPEKCGKSHLGEIWRAKSQAQPLTLKLLETIETLRETQNRFWIDIAQQDWPLSPQTEKALYRLYNKVTQREGALLLTAHTPPSRWTINLPDLKSRMRAVPCRTIKDPDDSDMKQMLEKIFETRQLRINSDVLARYLSQRVERSFQALHDIAEKLDHESLSSVRPITRALAREILTP